jgi:predicted transcriptional regulator YdeE
MEAKLIDFVVKNIGDVKLIGKEIRCIMNHPEGNPIPDFWMRCFKDDTFKVLDNPERIFGNAMIGWSGNFNPGDNSFSYVIGGFVRKSFPAPANFRAIDITHKEFAAGTIKGKEPDIYYSAYGFVKDEAQRRNCKLDDDAGYAMEWYDERFDSGNPEKVIELLIPAL